MQLIIKIYKIMKRQNQKGGFSPKWDLGWGDFLSILISSNIGEGVLEPKLTEFKYLYENISKIIKLYII